MKKQIVLEFDESQFSQEKIDRIIEQINSDNFGLKAMHTSNKFQKIRNWAKERGIYDKGDPKTQYIKLQEECGELARAILKDNEPEFIDAIGDCVVVLTNLAALKGFEIETCINVAYNQIVNRKGKMENGTFVKMA